LTKLRCALAGNGLLHLADVRSFLARICQMQKPTKMMKKSEKTRQGLYNVGFIGMRIAESRFRLAVVHPLIRGFGLGELHMSQIRKGGRVYAS